MALANPCPESPIPWKEREGGGRKRKGKRRKITYKKQTVPCKIVYIRNQ
jgi:hypothetical protein